MVRKGRVQKLSRHEHPHSVNRLRPIASGQIGILMTVPGNEIFRPVSAEKFRRLAFLAGRTGVGPRRYVVEDKPSSSALPSKDLSPVEPDRFLFFRTMISNHLFISFSNALERDLSSNPFGADRTSDRFVALIQKGGEGFERKIWEPIGIPPGRRRSISIPS
jgi:hypothetical protein